jgi:hypothetical protein
MCSCGFEHRRLIVKKRQRWCVGPLKSVKIIERHEPIKINTYTSKHSRLADKNSSEHNSLQIAYAHRTDSHRI